MRIQDDITLDIAKAVADVLEGKKPAVEVADPEAKGEKDFKDKHDIKKSGEKENGTVVKEAPFSPADVKKAVEVAMKMSGNMTDAVKKIEGIKKGLSKDSEVQDALQLANESFDMIHSEALDMNTSIEEAKESVEEAAVKVIPEKLPSMNRDEKDIADTLTKAGLVYGKVSKFDSGKFIDPKTGVSITIMRNGNAVAASSADGGTLLSPTDPSNLKAFLKKRGLIESPAIEEASKELGYTDVEEGEELSPKQKKYQDFFLKALKKFGATSPADLDVEKKKEFFNYIDKNYEADNEVSEDSAPMVEAPSTVIHALMPFQLFDKAGTSMMFNLSKDWNVNAVAQSNDRYVAFAGEPRDLEKMLKNHPKLKGKVDVKAIMSTAVKFTGKEKFGRQKGANFTN